jgi:hypothetical protein
MDLWYWINQNLQVDSWGVTPISLAAPFGLIVLIVMARRLAGERGPKMETADFAGMALIAVIIGAAFFWIFAGLGLMERSFR